MKNLWNNMISPLTLQEVMSLTSIQGKFHASALCFIFYVDSLHATWVFHQVPSKLLCPSIYIKFTVALCLTFHGSTLR
ncbi:hypothetical protein BHM03_00010445 [Ensete ventricosum]|nr:hypothetical protein BHM03_00010445 [Ensete ventricosum]